MQHEAVIPSASPRRILCVHQGVELYGSDRVFVQALTAFLLRWPDADITAVLPSEGELPTLLREKGFAVAIEPIAVLRRARMGETIATLLRFPAAVWHARRRIRAHDLTYISTVVLPDYMLATRLAGRPALVHVHELPTGRTRKLILALLGASRARLVFISQAVKAAFGPLADRPSDVVWNGVRDFPQERRAPDGRINLLMIGRFNAWKGQGLLIEALALLDPEARQRLRVRIVGSVYQGQDHFAEAIREGIARHGLQDCVEVCGFDPLPDAHYAWSDVVAVPSQKPEPFGLVAIEAMSAARAVLAANHGGLAEIVVDGETGRAVTPGDAASLAAGIAGYLADPALALEHGSKGRTRFEREFGEAVFLRRIAEAAARA